MRKFFGSSTFLIAVALLVGVGLGAFVTYTPQVRHGKSTVRQGDTRLHDGGVFGFGSEIGISTNKLHARGTMGLRELTTSKFLVNGNGQIRE